MRPQPGQRGHLGPARPGTRRRCRLRTAGRRRRPPEGSWRGRYRCLVLSERVDGEVHREHPQAEQVELHQPGRRAVVLVPLEHRPVLHAFHSIGQNSTSGRSAMTIPPEWMLRWRGKSSTCPARSRTSAGTGGPSDFTLSNADVPPPPVDPLREPVGVARREAGGLAISSSALLGPVRDHVGDLRRTVAPVLVVDVLDHLFATLMLDVEVDVRRTVALGREEPLEQQPERDGVGLGDAERAGIACWRRCPGPGSRCRCDGRTRRCRRAGGEAGPSPRSRRAVRDLAHCLLVLVGRGG